MCKRIVTLHQRKLTWEQAKELRKDKKSGMTNRALAKKYKVSVAAVSYIINFKTYKKKNVPGSSKGRTLGSEPGGVGSIPAPGTKT